MTTISGESTEHTLGTPNSSTSVSAAGVDDAPGRRRSRRRRTSHLKEVPATRALREAIREHTRKIAAQLPRTTPLTKVEMEAISRQILTDLDQPEGFVGWTMVMLASEFWREQVAAVPPQRRLFLLPHCLKHAEGCPADYDEFGLDCRKCGACSIADFRTKAEDMGYRVLVAEGSPIVLKIIVSGYVDAIVGVACLNVLEKAIDKVLLAGIPCMAVPLLSSDCRNTSVDEDWVDQMIHVRQETPTAQTKTYLHLLRTARGMFEPAELQRLVPRAREGGPSAADNAQVDDSPDPIAATEAMAHDFLAQGGKYARPFITLAAHDAVTGGRATEPDGAAHAAAIPDAVRRVALAIEVFHKASLVHDDVQDDDDYRYGEPTLHRRYGAPTAINVGDYLIGLGYRIVSREVDQLGPDVAADILGKLADAHTRLSEGQGAELLWRDRPARQLTPLDALKIYALKTAPAFEAALYCGLRMAGPIDDYAEPVKQLARQLGIAFQILNDLKDWQGDSDNKLAAGGDVFAGRPTLLRALASQSLEPSDDRRLDELRAREATSQDTIAAVRRMYEKAGVFEQAHRLVDKHQQRAESIADDLEPEPLRRLAYYLIDTVLDRPEEMEPPMVEFPDTSPAEEAPVS